MEAGAKLCILDDRHWLDDHKSCCYRCKYIKSYAYHTCSCFDPEIPPDIWNNKKTCPHWKKTED